MADEMRELQGIDWRRTFAFLEILRSFRLAANPAKIALCFLGLAASVGVGVLVDQIPGIGQTNVRVAGINPIEYRLASLGLDAGSRTSFYDNVHYLLTKALWGQWAIPYVDGKTWGDFSAFAAAPVTAAWDAVALATAYWQQARWFALLTTVLMLAIWAFIGGAVTRMTAVRIAREESVPLKQALRFSAVRWPSTATCVLIPFGVLVLVGLVAYVPAGAVLAIPYAGEIVLGLALPLSLAMGLICALVFVGGMFSIGLQWPTIAAEGADSFDAISRSISYISSRPWRYIFYTLFATVYGCLTFIFVKFLTFLTLRITHTGISLFWSAFTLGKGGPDNKLARLWDTPTLADPWRIAGGAEQFYAEAAAQHLFEFWIWIVMGMMAAFLISFFFTSQTVAYFLLRKIVDATDMEEVYLEESEEEELPLEHKADSPEIVKVSPAAKPADAKPGEAKPPDAPPKA
ncbi:MAG: hypothetical protein IMZ55_06715 [Acidobacteria bacterium]|nr:hypothetical protein [Planctomycetota bacterium]MBE3133146.1 hypothetical protein [Acidobacteriota bacterium]